MARNHDTVNRNQKDLNGDGDVTIGEKIRGVFGAKQEHPEQKRVQHNSHDTNRDGDVGAKEHLTDIAHKVKDGTEKVHHEVEKTVEHGKGFVSKVKGLFSVGKDTDHGRDSHKAEHGKDGPNWYQRNVKGMEFKPVENANIRDFNEDGKVDKSEAQAYKSMKELKESGKLNDKSFEKAVENLHDKCRGQNDSVHASQVRGGGQAPAAHR